MKKILSISALATLISSPIAHAVCPVCIVAVGAGLGLAEWLGIDDTISGLWIGGLTASLIIWTITWLNAKSSTLRNSESSAFGREKSNFGRKAELWKKAARNTLIAIGYYLLIVGPLWWKGFIGKNPFNTFCGMNRLLFGIILGTVLFAIGVIFHNYLRKKNEGKSYFKGQKIVMAITPLIIASIILYFVC